MSPKAELVLGNVTPAVLTEYLEQDRARPRHLPLRDETLCGRERRTLTGGHGIVSRDLTITIGGNT
jgi:hypothetical protein